VSGARAQGRDPRSHWLLLAAVLLVATLLLVIAGYTHGHHGEGPRAPEHAGELAGVPPAIRAGGPLLDARSRRAGAHIPARTIALTFDDGPSTWTPRVLAILERYQVPATFFVIGEDVAARPELLRRMIRDGDEIGVHTFTHPDLASLPAWQERLEIDQTQLVIAAATGYTTDLLRPPFSSVPSALDAGTWRAIKRSGNYRVVLADLDTRDWSRPGANAIVRDASPTGTRGAVIMLHDGGGDRSQTVAALARLVPALKARGYRFVTASQAAVHPPPWHPASFSQRARGSALIFAVLAADWFARMLWWAFAIAGVLSVVRVGVLVLFARRHRRRDRQPPLRYLPPVSVMVPAYNERAGIVAAVHSLAASHYPVFEVVVVDDGSTDGTAELVESLALPNVRVIRRPNGGKPAALNTGIAAALHDVLVLVDGDTVFEPGTLLQLVTPFADPQVGAVSGNTKVGNRRGLLGRWQHVEYVIGFNLDRRMFDVLRCMPTVPGAIGAFRRVAIAQAGGVSDDTLAEDTDLTMAICRAGWRVVYAPDALAWTEAPASLGQLWRQRYRWCYGTLQAMWKHKRAVVESGASGRLGRRGLPYLFLFQVLLPLLAPLIDVAAIYGLLAGDATAAAIAWLGLQAAQYVAAVYAFRLDRESQRPLWTLPVQQVLYRQLMYLVVIQSVASALYGVRLRWHKLRRTGDVTVAARAIRPGRTP
jgi:cellulose synthase/poly-beta-1,6-N-acetylglucosamine synthase-like glycosyltransferase/peptidoglycan/xylan/chitin deacetylase (PgdA/CDA1 family)